MPLFREGSESPLDPQLYDNEQTLERMFTTVTLMVASMEQTEYWNQGVPEHSVLFQKKHY